MNLKRKTLPTPVVSRLTTPSVSYYLLGKKIFFIVNSNARSGNVTEIIRKISKGFPLYSFNVILSSATKVASELTRDVVSDDSLFIVMGGDGTVNASIQYLVDTPATFGLIPKGTANDLASHFQIPPKMDKALQVIAEGNVTLIDSMKVNANHILTIGSVGFPAFVADSVNRFKSGSWLARYLHRHVFRSAIYQIFAVFLAMVKGSQVTSYEGSLEIDGEEVYSGRFVAIFFGKQEILGKAFKPCPNVTHADQFIRISVLKYRSLASLFMDLFWIGKGKPERSKNFEIFSAQNFRIRTNDFVHLLGDGEILDYDDEFSGKRIDRCLRLIVPRKNEGV